MREPLLSVRGVHKRFSSVHAVAGVSFDVHGGEIFGFLGPNGAGKTTTLRMIMGITRPDEGDVAFEGAPELDRSRVGYLPEERGLFEDATPLDTLVYLGRLRRMSAHDARSAAARALERMGLADRAKEKVNALSKGNQQKVQFAGAVLHGPALAVLDEPFSGLDPLNQELFLDMIRELRDRGTAILLSAHQLDLVERLCDRFHLISKGRGILEGTLEEVRREAAGGAGEVLGVDLRTTAPASAETDAHAALKRVAPDTEWTLAPLTDGAFKLEISLPRGVNLAPVLSELGDVFRIERVEMRPLRLHEIYVRAVQDDHAAIPEPEPREVVSHA